MENKISMSMTAHLYGEIKVEYKNVENYNWVAIREDGNSRINLHFESQKQLQEFVKSLVKETMDIDIDQLEAKVEDLEYKNQIAIDEYNELASSTGSREVMNYD